MFKSNYYFCGTHATKAKLLKNPSGREEEPTFFARLADVYAIAPVIGFFYGTVTQPETSGERAGVLADQVIKISKSLQFSYQLIMLLDESYEPCEDKRIDNAFRYTDTENEIAGDQAKRNLERFNEYVLGGVDKLYEKLIEPGTDEESYLRNLYEFLEEVSQRWNLPSASEELDSIIDAAKH